MLGMRFIRFQPSTYALRYWKGRVVAEGPGLSFFYYAPMTSLVAVPVSSVEAPFIFEEIAADFQAVTIQGQVTYRIAEPAKIARLLNYTLDATGHAYAAEDPQKLPQRVVNAVQVLTRKQVMARPLREVLRSAETLISAVDAELRANPEINSLGLEILGLGLLAVRPTKETARALEAETRERILKEADDAIYARRNAAVEQERKIKENELNTEIAVENKKRQIREAQMDAERAVQEKQHALQDAAMTFAIAQEQEKAKLVDTQVRNARAEADANAYAVGAVLKSFAGVDPAVVQSLATMGMKPDQLIALAFQGLAEKAQHIGQLNVTPDLLKELLQRPQ